MKTLFEPLTIRNTQIANRICVPPMVCFNWAGEDGIVSDQHVEHYRAMAAGEPGLIIQEATCVTDEGKLAASQLGIWSDDHIPGLRRITEAVHAHGVPILVQIHHAGVVGIAEEALCPSPYQLENGKVGREMTEADLTTLRTAFIEAARRAHEAGYDGVELHGCHSYLLSQFLNGRVNRRADRYGEEPLLFVQEIIEGIRTVTPDDFIVGIRLGAFEPTLEDGLRHAEAIEAMGIDFLNISYGFGREHDPVTPPEGFPFKDIVYAAGAFAKRCGVPVFAVNGIRTPEQAEAVLQLTDVNMACIARSILVDYRWPAKAKAGVAPGICLDCKTCQWRIDHRKCPGRLKLMRDS